MVIASPVCHKLPAPHPLLKDEDLNEGKATIEEMVLHLDLKKKALSPSNLLT